MTVHNNSWDLNFDNFSEFQNVPPSLCVRKSICVSPLALYSFFRNLPCSTPSLLAVDADRIFVTLNIFCVSRTRCFFLLIHFLVVEDYELPIEIFSFLIKKDMVSDLNMFHGKMSDFVSFPLLGFTLVIKLICFDFESHWNILIVFDKERYGVRI